MRVYRGVRTGDARVVTVRDEDGAERPLDPRFDLRNHSPDGFNWGYGGSGPAQLALALCADVLGNDERVRAVYQRVKFSLVGRLEGDRWELTDVEIHSAVEAAEAE